MAVWPLELSVKYIITKGTPCFCDTEVQLSRPVTPKSIKICWNCFGTWNYNMLTYRNKQKIRPCLKLLIFDIPDPKDHNRTQFRDPEPLLHIVHYHWWKQLLSLAHLGWQQFSQMLYIPKVEMPSVSIWSGSKFGDSFVRKSGYRQMKDSCETARRGRTAGFKQAPSWSILLQLWSSICRPARDMVNSGEQKNRYEFYRPDLSRSARPTASTFRATHCFDVGMANTYPVRLGWKGWWCGWIGKCCSKFAVTALA